MFKREELAGKFVIDTKEIELDTRVATEQLNGRGDFVYHRNGQVRSDRASAKVSHP